MTGEGALGWGREGLSPPQTAVRDLSLFSPVVCHLEGSGQWPQEAEAIRRVRAAFQLRLAELLTQQHGLQCRATATHTDVLKVGLVQGRGSPREGGDRGCQGAPGQHVPPIPYPLPTGWVCVPDSCGLPAGAPDPEGDAEPRGNDLIEGHACLLPP